MVLEVGRCRRRSFSLSLSSETRDLVAATVKSSSFDSSPSDLGVAGTESPFPVVGNDLAVLRRVEIQVVISLVEIDACGVSIEVSTVVAVAVTWDLIVSNCAGSESESESENEHPQGGGGGVRTWKVSSWWSLL